MSGPNTIRFGKKLSKSSITVARSIVYKPWSERLCMCISHVKRIKMVHLPMPWPKALRLHWICFLCSLLYKQQAASTAALIEATFEASLEASQQLDTARTDSVQSQEWGLQPRLTCLMCQCLVYMFEMLQCVYAGVCRGRRWAWGRSSAYYVFYLCCNCPLDSETLLT